MDSKSIGLCPQGFESPRCRLILGVAAPQVRILKAEPCSALHEILQQTPRARGVVVSHPLSMREALGSIPSVSMFAPRVTPHSARPAHVFRAAPVSVASVSVSVPECRCVSVSACVYPQCAEPRNNDCLGQRVTVLEAWVLGAPVV